MMDNRPATPEDIGTLLKARREQLGRSLTEAALHTRIRKTLLESIESNQFEKLPGQVYVIGFIRVYATYLGLDSDPLLAQLEDVVTKPKALSLKAVPVSKSPSRRSKKSTLGEGWGLFSFGFLGVLLLGAALYFLPELLQDQEPVVVVVNPIASQPEAAAANSTAAEDGSVVETTAAAAGGLAGRSAEETVTAAQEAARLPDSAVPGDAVVNEEPALSSPLPSIPEQGASLRMLALAESSLIIYVDERKAHEYKLHNGLDLTWKVSRKARVELAEPGVARFWLGGEELDLVDRKTFQLQRAARE